MLCLISFTWPSIHYVRLYLGSRCSARHSFPEADLEEDYWPGLFPSWPVRDGSLFPNVFSKAAGNLRYVVHGGILMFSCHLFISSDLSLSLFKTELLVWGDIC